MANRKGVKVKRRRDVQIKKVKKYISKHIYSFVCGGAFASCTAYCDSSCNRN